MKHKTRRLFALSIIGLTIGLMGCETLRVKKAPPGQVKKVTGEQSAGKNK